VAREYWYGGLYILREPWKGCMFAKVLGVDPRTVYVRLLAQPPVIRWRKEIEFPTLVIVPHESDPQSTRVEVSSMEMSLFSSLTPRLAAVAGVTGEEGRALNALLLEGVQEISQELLSQLQQVEPSRYGDVDLNPCRVTLRDGRVLPRILMIDADQWHQAWGDLIEDKDFAEQVPIQDVVRVEESAFRLPAQLASKMYAAGESAMGGSRFALILEDGRRFFCGTGAIVDFVDLPPDVTVDQVVELIPHEGRLVRDRLDPSDFAICFFRMPSGEASAHKTG
jgi:hypothetical protein